MNRIAERVAAVMNDDELQTLILSQYEQDAQTLTSGAEANLLKFKHLCGWATAEDEARWKAICDTFQRNQKFRGIEAGDRFGQVIVEMGEFSNGLSSIRQAVSEAAATLKEQENASAPVSGQLEQLTATAGNLAAGLESIRTTLESGIAEVGKGNPDPAEEDRQILATFAPESMELLTKFVAELQMATSSRQQASLPSEVYGATHPVAAKDERGSEIPAAATAHPAPDATVSSPPGPGPYQVEVINRIPRVFLSIIREQFLLMQQWMEPLTKVTSENRESFAEIRQQLHEAMDTYRVLIQKLDAGESLDSE